MNPRWVVAFTAVVVVLAGASTASAWTGPSGSPPNNNVAAPVNVGSTYQEKSGSMWVDGGFGINQGSAYCIGTSCITSWAQAASGSIGGSGTSPYVPVFTNGTTLGNSSISSNTNSSTENGNFYVDGLLDVQQPSTTNWAGIIDGSNYGLYVKSGGTSWAGDFIGGGADGVVVSNANGSYAEIADGAYGLIASSSSGLYAYLATAAWSLSGDGPTYTSSYSRADGGFCIGSSCITSWTQAGAGGTIGGSGSSPYVPVFTGTSTLGNSSLSSNSNSSTENGNLVVTGSETVGSTLRLDYNQVWNTSTNLYLQYNGLASSTVIIGGQSGVPVNLLVANGTLNVGGNYEQNGTPGMTGTVSSNVYGADGAGCTALTLTIQGGIITNAVGSLCY